MSAIKSAVEQNRFLSHGVGLSGLLHNLKKHEPEWCGGMMKGYDAERLKAIKDQAANVKSQAIWGLQAIAATLAVASSSGELPDHKAADVAWAMEFLADIAEEMDLVESNSQYEIEELKKGGLNAKLSITSGNEQ